MKTCATCEGTGLANVVDPHDGALVIDDCPECGGELVNPAFFPGPADYRRLAELAVPVSSAYVVYSPEEVITLKYDTGTGKFRVVSVKPRPPLQA